MEQENKITFSTSNDQKQIMLDIGKLELSFRCFM